MELFIIITLTLGWINNISFISWRSVLLVKETEGNNRISLSETALQPYQLHLGTGVSRLTHNEFQD
jgi:hypothetical protein